MRVLDGLERRDHLDRQCILTIGNFDGVHLAHRRILECARELGRELGTKTTVLTFEPHPLSVVAPMKTPLCLTPRAEKLRLLGELGVDTVVVAKSEPKLLSLEPEAFVEQVIHDMLSAICVVEGPSFGFGKARRGNVPMLQRLCKEFGCDARIVDPVMVTWHGEEMLVSSSLIRRQLLDGQVEKAGHCLGRRYAMFGSIVEGKRRGRELGFPTANLGPVSQLVPGDGVYAGWATVDCSRYMAAISVGQSPTFKDADQTVEFHLPDFNGDLYGRRVRLEFEAKLRDQRRFESGESLTAQICLDVSNVKSILAARNVDLSNQAASDGN